jgi:CRP-like cAMP-binding protein
MAERLNCALAPKGKSHGSETRPRCDNRLLSRLSASDFGSLKPYLDTISLVLRLPLEKPNKPIRYVYFPESGVASVVAVGAGDRNIEIGLIGREGMSGMAVVMGDGRSPHSTYMQVAGHGHRIEAKNLRRAMGESSSLQLYFLRYAHAFAIQTAYTALANASGNVGQRLARWLLMAHDRLDGQGVPLTHEFLSIMLGVRRAGVTVALQILEARRLVSTHRGLILVADRAGLEAFADGLYGTPEAEYRRLTAESTRTNRSA